MTAKPARADEFDAIVLAGGRGSRLGGVDKPALEIAGRSLLALALDAVADARRVVVVRGSDDLAPDERVSRVVERPRWAGPAAAVAAGLAELDRRAGERHHDGAHRTTPGTADLVAVLAADLPRAAEALGMLRAATLPAGADGVMAIDPAGRDQPLLALYRTESLRRAIAAVRPVAGLGIHRVLSGLDLARIGLPAELCADVDTPAHAAAHAIALPLGALRAAG